MSWAGVVAQLVERSRPIPEVRGSNPAIGKIYIEYLFTCLLSTVLKRGREWPTFKNNNNMLIFCQEPR